MLMLIPRRNRKHRKCRREEAGYSLLMVVFLVATSLVLSAVVLPNLLTQGRREREQELIWRGNQYQRAIGMYFRKFGRYPTKVDDLTKQTNGVRFLRQAYKDPMNKDDGSWRFIYVGPNGQLIGSVHSQSLLQSLVSGPTIPGSGLQGLGGQQSPPSGTAAAAGSAAGGLSQFGQPAAGQQQSGGGLAPNSLQPQAQPLSGDVIGGNIIGVGSKIKEPSLMVYQGSDTYQQWEFIWNPTQQVAIPGQAAPVAPAVPTAPGQQQPQPTPSGAQPQQAPSGLPGNNTPGAPTQ
jgi:type II secretory pathway pseudopilin PulG